MSDEQEQEIPLITVTFISEDGFFEQKRMLTIEQAESLRDDLTAEIAEAKRKYNT